MASLTRTIQASSLILHQLAVEVGSRWESVKVVLQQHHAGLLKQVQVGEEHPQVESHRRAAPPRAAGLILSLSLGSPICQRTNFHCHLQIHPCQASCSADQRESGNTFDPKAGMACTMLAHSVCSNLDINLVCNPSSLTCNCRRNMAWNPVAKECQVRNSKYVFSKYV